MNISNEEKLMYEVMKAIYDSGIPMSFKGSMVLKAFLLESRYAKDTRHTVDIDANWHGETTPTMEQITESLQKALDRGGINLNVTYYRRYGNNRSAGFELRDKSSRALLFTMDVDINRPMVQTKIYEVSGLAFRGVIPSQMIADKLSVISEDKVFRRIKDLVDLYYLSHVCNFNREDILSVLKSNGKELGTFAGFLNRTEDLKHSYEKFRFVGGVNKPTFAEVYLAVKTFIADVLP